MDRTTKKEHKKNDVFSTEYRHQKRRIHSLLIREIPTKSYTKQASLENVDEDNRRRKEEADDGKTPTETRKRTSSKAQEGDGWHDKKNEEERTRKKKRTTTTKATRQPTRKKTTGKVKTPPNRKRVRKPQSHWTQKNINWKFGNQRKTCYHKQLACNRTALRNSRDSGLSENQLINLSRLSHRGNSKRPRQRHARQFPCGSRKILVRISVRNDEQSFVHEKKTRWEAVGILHAAT